MALYLTDTSTPAALLAAVVLQAIEDLDSTLPLERWEAIEFFAAPDGPWAEQRRLYFDALGLDEAKVQGQLAERLIRFEKPAERLTAGVLYRDLPKTPFSATSLAGSLRRGYAQVRGLLQTLEQRGLVVRTGRGEFCRADSYQPAPAPAPKALAPDWRLLVLDTLRDGPKSIRAINIALEGELGTDRIRALLKEAEAQGLVRYDLPDWELVSLWIGVE